MMNSLINLSGKIESDWVDVLRHIEHCTASLKIPYVLIGAAARDLLLKANDLTSERATRDIDFSIEVIGWESFDQLKSCLLTLPEFEQDRSKQRLIFRKSLPIDLVPFGTIEEQESEISWPPDYAVKMSVLGMSDVLESAISIRIADKPHVLDVPVARIAGIGLLKLLAWNERKLTTKKDAQDFYYLLQNYIDIGNINHLAENHVDLFDDIDTAHARLLARDIKDISSKKTQQAITDILIQEIKSGIESYLIQSMLPKFHEATDSKKILIMLKAMETEFSCSQVRLSI
ncbi:MAG: nucleotidyl transferase AbiEii/AbiGii toxin family protein [Cocleimonas sp.]|nr:nucleotidyl transferase AbiEii/AbiGii toxin family protein [Cocleimonas sp.]